MLPEPSNDRAGNRHLHATTDRLDELFDVVDEHDVVTGRASRGEVHRNGWMHRAVHVFVLTSRNEILLQRRSVTKQHAPLLLDSSCSGHVDAGESYDHSAVRELWEEVGLRCDLLPLQKFKAEPRLAQEHTWLYAARCDDTPTLHPQEVDCLYYWPVSDVAARVASHPDEFAGCFRVLFDWFWTECWNQPEQQVLLEAALAKKFRTA